MIRVSRARSNDLRPCTTPELPQSSSVSAYDLARELAREVEQVPECALVIDNVYDEDSALEASSAAFTNDGIALIERVIANALKNGGIRP